MKKRLLCLPLVATMLGGCNLLGLGGEGSLLSKLDVLGLFTGKDTTDETGGNNNTSGGNNNTSGGNNNTSGGGSTVTLGSKIATITMKSPGTTGTKVTDDKYTWTSGSCTVTVETGNNSNADQKVSDSVGKAGSNEARIYMGYSMTLSCTSNFSGFSVETTTFSNSAYVWDDPHLDGATVEFDGNVTTKVALESPTTSFNFINSYKQFRVTSISFYA